MNTNTISKKLTELRKAQNLTQIELSDKINYSDKVISKWERGESLPSIEAFKLLSDFYGVSIDELIRSEELTTSNNSQKLIITETKKPSDVLKYSFYFSTVLFILATIYVLWAGISMLWPISILLIITTLLAYSINGAYVSYEADYQGNKIKFTNKPTQACLYINDILVDEDNNLFTFGSTLTGKINQKTLKVKISANLTVKCTMFIE